LKKITDKNNSPETIQKREKLVSGLIVVIAIIVGVLITFLITGILDFVK
jgi:cell division protein FtsL